MSTPEPKEVVRRLANLVLYKLAQAGLYQPAGETVDASKFQLEVDRGMLVVALNELGLGELVIAVAREMATKHHEVPNGHRACACNLCAAYAKLCAGGKG